MSRIPGARTRLAVVGGLLALAVTACGGGSSGSGGVASLSGSNGNSSSSSQKSTSTASFRKQLLAYAQCMRDHGVDFPDPQFDANGRPQFDGGGRSGNFADVRNSPAFEKARSACESERPDFAGQFQQTPEQQAQTRKNLLAFAKCMRGKGVDFPDPTFDANGRPQFNRDGAGGGAFDRNDPTVTAARDACQKQVGGTFGRGGPGGGFGPPGGPRDGGSGNQGSGNSSSAAASTN